MSELIYMSVAHIEFWIVLLCFIQGVSIIFIVGDLMSIEKHIVDYLKGVSNG